MLPHDWAVSQPFSKVMPQAEEQGYGDRYGIGWYKNLKEGSRWMD